MQYNEYKKCFDQIQTAFCIVSVIRADDGKAENLEFKYVNQAYARLENKLPEELLNKRVTELYPNDSTAWLNMCDEALGSDDTAVKTLRISHCERSFTVQIQKTDEDCCSCIFTDVTELLDDVNTYYRKILVTAPHGIVVYDTSCGEVPRVSFFNDGIFSIMKCEKQDIMNFSYIDVCPPIDTDCRKVHIAMKKVREIKEPVIVEYRFKAPNEKIRHINLRISIMPNEPEKLYAAYTDVTSAKLSEKRARDDNDKLKAVVEQADFLLWEYDCRSNRIINSDALMQKLMLSGSTTKTPEAIIESGSIYSDCCDDFLKLHTDMQNGQKVSEKKIRLSSPFGESWFLIRYTNVFDEEGCPSVAFATAQSMTMYKELEEQFMITSEQNGIYVWTLDFNSNNSIQSEEMIKNYGRFPNVKSMYKFPEARVESGSIHVSNISSYIKAFNKLFSGASSITIKYRTRNCKTGKWDWIRSSYNVIRRPNGEILRIVASGVVINKLVDAENKYQAFQNHSRLAFDDALASFHFDLTHNWCGDGQACDDYILEMQEGGTVDSFFEYAYSHFKNTEELKKFKSVFSRKNLIDLFIQGKATQSLEYRYCLDGKREIWVKTVIDMVENLIDNKVSRALPRKNCYRYGRKPEYARY